MMRRILVLVTVTLVMAVMMVAMALPAMAAPGGGAQHFDLAAGVGSISGVITPSGVANFRFSEHPAGDNAGGTGGGGAVVVHETPFFVVLPQGGFLDDNEAQFVGTPSGNLTAIGHLGRPN